MDQKSPKPVLTAIDTSAHGLIALRLAAAEAAARNLPLRLLVTQPAAVWNNPIAMAAPRAGSFAEDDTVREARVLVRDIRAAYPGLRVSVAAAHDAKAAVRKQSATASMLVEAATARPGILSGTGWFGGARCPVVTTNGSATADVSGPVIVIGDNLREGTVSLAHEEARRRSAGVTVTSAADASGQIEDLTGRAALVVTQSPKRLARTRDRQLHQGLLTSARCPVLIAPVR